MINEMKLTELDINYIILLVAFRTDSSSTRVSLIPAFYVVANGEKTYDNYVVANGEKTYGTIRFEQNFKIPSQKVNIKIVHIFDSAVNVDNTSDIDLISFYRDMMK